MNTFRLVLCAILLALLMGGCSTSQSPLAPVVGEESMKGYELYSWENDGTWYFSVLIGTNRVKMLEEIQAPDTTLKGIGELEPILETLASGQYVTWTALEPLAFPPEEIIRQVEKICREQELNLTIAK